jgi:hypothetical protein
MGDLSFVGVCADRTLPPGLDGAGTSADDEQASLMEAH